MELNYMFLDNSTLNWDNLMKKKKKVRPCEKVRKANMKGACNSHMNYLILAYIANHMRNM